jgi:hypothetical protein
MLKRVSSSLYLLILICFFLPFLSVSCQKQEVVTVTGIDLATGKDLPGENILWSGEHAVPPQPWAVATLVLALAGAAAGLLKRKAGAFWGILLGLSGMISLFLLKNKMDGELIRYSKLLFKVQYEPWYWTALILFGLAALSNLVGMIARPPINHR